MYTIIKMATVVGDDGTVLNEYVSQVEMEDGIAVWVKGSANKSEALQFDVETDRLKIDAVTDLILDGLNQSDFKHCHVSFAIFA